jgi:hypothetical protein
MGERITGHIELLYPSPYLKAADLGGKDCTVTISHMEWDDVPQAGKSETVRKPVVFFLGADGKLLKKKLASGPTIGRQIGDALGEKDTAKWSGKRITLYGTTTKGKGGKTVECVRVRARVNQTATEAPSAVTDAPAAREEQASE